MTPSCELVRNRRATCSLMIATGRIVSAAHPGG
jgi:hypothetical protein